MGKIDKVALVTGGSRGIGKAIALKLAGNGFNLAIVGTNAGALGQTQSEIEEYSVKCLIIQADLGRDDAPLKIISAVIEEFNRIDVLVNNAGMAFSQPVSETTPEMWENIFRVNAKAPYFLCKEAITHLMKSEKPVIVNIGSVVGFKGYIHQSAYASSKHALAGFTKVLAKEVQPLDIRVHLVSPGGVHTEMVQEMRPDIDTSQLIHPSEIAEVVWFLVNRQGNGTIDHLYMRRNSGLAFD